MQERQDNDSLLDLRPQHLGADNAAEIEKIQTRGGSTREEIETELAYLRIISARKVRLPNDAYFATVRQRIEGRVSIRKISWLDRFVAIFVPETFRPIPAALATAAIAVAITIGLMYFPSGNIIESPLIAEGYGPYISISDMYSQHVEVVEQGELSEQELREYREILLMSRAILGSPSSLSRSRTLAPTRL